MASKKKKKVTIEPEANKDNANKKGKTKKKKKKKRQKTETDTKSKEQRRKILEFRAMQSRFALPTIDDSVESSQQITTPPPTPSAKYIESKSDDNIPNDDDDNDNKSDDGSIIFLELSESQEDIINILEIAFEEYDEDYYGFIEYDKFLSILKQNKINLSQKQETFLMIALTLIDEGVDYYGFLQLLRNKAVTHPNDNLTKICQQIAIDAEQKANTESKEKEEAKDKEIEVDEDELNKFYEAAQNARSRGMSLATMNRTSTIIPASNKIRQIVEQFALDGVEVDFAIFKTALAAIDCNPKDQDLIFLINYLAYNEQQNNNNNNNGDKKNDDNDDDNNGENNVEIENTMDDDDIFVDFNYFISFCQEVSNIPVVFWKNPEQIIEKVAKQTRIVYRTQQRRKQDKVKAKKRLENRHKVKQHNKKKHEIKQIEAEEKRLRALRLREKAKMVSAPKKDEEKLKLREWIKKRGKKNSKKAQHELKKWMQTNNVFQKNLYNELGANGVTSMDGLKNVGAVKMDTMLRKVRSDRFAEVKNTNSRNKLDKLLVNFEKKWRKMANVKDAGKKKGKNKSKKKKTKK